MKDAGMQSELGRVRGLGSARDGVHHWWMQRLTAIALVPLLLWFVISIAGLAGTGHQQAVAFLSAPPVAIVMILLLLATFWHAALGVQVVIEDYVHHEGWKFAWLIVNRLGFFVLGVTALFAVLKLAL